MGWCMYVSNWAFIECIEERLKTLCTWMSKDFKRCILKKDKVVTWAELNGNSANIRRKTVQREGPICRTAHEVLVLIYGSEDPVDLHRQLNKAIDDPIGHQEAQITIVYMFGKGQPTRT